ncbi:MAG: porin [Rikenellaceae bacterium]|nr:porin [Rikenellaceae bacterium]MCL2692274.1 porin [Rikenellaceae bacterium]
MKKLLTIFCGSMLSISAMAQQPEVSELEKRIEALEATSKSMQKFKVSGYIQTQFQWGEEAASLRIGTANEDPTKSFSRFGIRRGRIKFTYDASSLASGVFQLDITERGVSFKDAYFDLRNPWVNTVQLRAGIFDRPFGTEVAYSSSRRESPERSVIFRTLFPDERDLGAMVILQARKNSAWNFLKLEAGLFAGNGIRPETDSRRDFIGHLSADKKFGKVSLGGGVSYYNGGVWQGSPNVYTMDGNGFTLNNNADNVGKFAKREYFGADLRFVAGTTKLHAEYLWGTQPATAGSSNSPNWTALPTHDTYIRPFSGWYAMLVQQLGNSPFTAVLKYDVYDPNTKVAGNDIGLNGTSRTDISYNTLGLGALWAVSSAVRLQAYYEIVRNEKSENVAGFEKDRKDNVFTLRLQYRF